MFLDDPKSLITTIIMIVIMHFFVLYNNIDISQALKARNIDQSKRTKNPTACLVCLSSSHEELTYCNSEVPHKI